MQAKHTPGPWRAIGAGVYTGAPQDDISHIATAHFYGVLGDPMANAALIAAAPDLLAALQQIAQSDAAAHSYPGDGWRLAHEKFAAFARAAIARATGEA